MSIRSGFFNAVKNESDGSYDRKYYASEFAGYFASFIGNGIFGKQLDEFKVKAKINPDMGVVVSPGRAWINGYWIESTEEVELPISVNTSTSERVDLVVLGLNLNTREISIYVKNGNSTNGVIRDESTYELCIAKINVSPTTVNIQQTNISDQRQNYELCGYAELLINHDIDELTTFINEYVNRANSDYLVWLNVIQGLVDQLEGLISEDAAGALQIQINTLRDEMGKKLNAPNTSISGFVYMEGSDKSTSTKLPFEILKLSEGIIKLRLMVNKASGAVTISPDTIKAIVNPRLYVPEISSPGMGKWLYEILSAKMTIDDEYDFLNYYAPGTSLSPESRISVRLVKDGGVTIDFSTGMRPMPGYTPKTYIELFLIRKDVENVIIVEGSIE